MKNTRSEGSWRFIAGFQEAVLAKHDTARLSKETLKDRCTELGRQSLSCIVENTRLWDVHKGKLKAQSRATQERCVDATSCCCGANQDCGGPGDSVQATWHCKVQRFLCCFQFCFVLFPCYWLTSTFGTGMFILCYFIYSM